MATQTGKDCVTCQRQTFHKKQHAVNHILHFLITIFTCGLWVVPWVIMSLGNNFDPWICTVCGSETR